MDITPYVESIRRDLAAAAEAGGPEARASAERLALALDPAVRLALMDAMSQAAAEITSELPAGSVDVRLRGREPQFVVELPTMTMADTSGPVQPTSTALDDAADDDDDAGTVARITLRIPESLKAKAEEMAARGGRSLNTWIVHAVRNATRERALNVDIDVSSLHLFEDGPRGRGRAGNRRMTGWV